MTLKRAQQIRDVWDSIEEADPDISTARLMGMTAERCNCDNGDVGEALGITEDARKEVQP